MGAGIGGRGEMFRGIVNWLGCFDVAVSREGGCGKRLEMAPPQLRPHLRSSACEVSAIATAGAG